MRWPCDGGESVNAILNYPGAKWGMAQEIVQIMPPHRSYLEPFAGSLAVLFNKPRSAIETVNDIDGDIVNFFCVLRADPERLAREIDLTPYARAVVNVRPRIKLQPFRTFLEVAQPESEFLLRVDSEKGIAFFEADGGIWRLEAKRNIAEYFERGLKDLIEQGKVVIMQ